MFSSGFFWVSKFFYWWRTEAIAQCYSEQFRKTQKKILLWNTSVFSKFRGDWSEPFLAATFFIEKCLDKSSLVVYISILGCDTFINMHWKWKTIISDYQIKKQRKCIEPKKHLCNIFFKFWAIIVDRVHLPQGSLTTTMRQVIFNHQVPWSFVSTMWAKSVMMPAGTLTMTFSCLSSYSFT